MALLEGCGCDLDELAVILKFLYVVRTCEAHTAADSAAHLEDHVFHFAFIGYASFNALGNELLGVLLEVSVLTSVAAMEPMPLYTLYLRPW